MTYVLRRSDGAYVARDSELHSYTWELEHAQTFETEGAANFARCSNEEVVDVDDLVGRG